MRATETISLVFVTLSLSLSSCHRRAVGEWSKPVNGVQGRIRIESDVWPDGTRHLNTLLELRSKSPIDFEFEDKDWSAKLVDDHGNAIAGEGGIVWGPIYKSGVMQLMPNEPVTVPLRMPDVLPHGAKIILHAGGWVLHPSQNGKVFLRVTMAKPKEGKNRWDGSLTMPEVAVRW